MNLTSLQNKIIEAIEETSSTDKLYRVARRNDLSTEKKTDKWNTPQD